MLFPETRMAFPFLGVILTLDGDGSPYLEISASYAYSGELGSQFPLAIAPRWNIVADGEAFHLYLQPEVGYDVMRNGMFYSGRVGIGCVLGSLFFGVSYNRTVFDRIQYQIGYVYNWQ